jgi:hypothetical protein
VPHVTQGGGARRLTTGGATCSSSSLGEVENVSKTRITAAEHVTRDETEVCRTLHGLRAAPQIFAEIAAGGTDELALQKSLRRSWPDELVRAALLQHDLRRRAKGKFRPASEMWFDRVGLEQSTSEAVARHKAARFTGDVDDLCCGIGGDTLALAAHCRVRAIDRRPSLTLMTEWNAEVYGVRERVETATGDVQELVSTDRLIHLDADRRSGARRSTRIEDYAPPLEFMQRLIDTCPGGAIKLSPASNFGGKFPDCEIELVSLAGECKEAVVWFGALAGEQPSRATLLPSGLTIAGDPLQARAELLAVGSCLYDPDPAVVRSGLLDVVACELGLGRLDEEEEYLTSQTLVRSEFVTPFVVLDELPNNEKQIRSYFRAHPFGQVEIKCRHLPVDPNKMRRRLPLTGTDAVTLILARVGGRSRAVVCQRVSDPAG